MDRFNLEAAIMASWQTKDDLELLYSSIEEVSEEAMQNALLGIIQLADLRSKKLFSVYEDLVSARKIN